MLRDKDAATLRLLARYRDSIASFIRRLKIAFLIVTNNFPIGMIDLASQSQPTKEDNNTDSRIRHLITDLDDPDFTIRSAAARTLGSMGPVAAEAAPALFASIGDPSASVRWEVNGALTKIGPAAVSLLAAGLGNIAVSVRRSSVIALRRIGCAATPPLSVMLDDTDEEVRRSGAVAFGFIGQPTPSVVRAVAPTLIDPVGRVRLAGIDTLSKLGLVARDVLIDALGHPDVAVRKTAVNGLEKLGSPAIPALTDALRNGDMEVRYLASASLGRMGAVAETAAPLLALELDSASKRLRERAAESLRQLGPAAVKVLSDVLTRSATPASRRLAAHTLGEIGEDASMAIPALVGCLKDSDASIRRAAMQALEKIRSVNTAFTTLGFDELDNIKNSAPDDLIDKPVHILADSEINSEMHAESDVVKSYMADLYVSYGHEGAEMVASRRYKAIEALRGMGRAGASAMVTAFPSANPDLQRELLDALGELGSGVAGAVPALILALDHPDAMFRQEVVYVIGQIGPAAWQAKERLEIALNDSNVDVQSYAAIALQKLAGIGPYVSGYKNIYVQDGRISIVQLSVVLF